MTLPFYTNFRLIISISIMGLGIGLFVIVKNSKEKLEYDKSDGKIVFLGKEFQDLPKRHKGDYRYLKIDSYPYIFQIYLPNSDPTDKTLDDLKEGDCVEIFYYESKFAKEDGINRYVQFIDFNGQPYFIRSGFQAHLGYLIIILFFLLTIGGYVLWKKGKLEW